MQAELYLSRRGAYASDLPKVAVRNRVVRVPVTRNIEDIEKVSAESHDMLLPNVKILEQRGVNLAVAGSALGTVVRTAKSKWSCAAVGTGPVVHSGRAAGLRGRISPPPVIDRAVADDHGTVLIRAAQAPSCVVCIAGVRAKDGNRQ